MASDAKKKFNCQPLEQLSRQLMFAPDAKRRQQVLRAEQLHDEIDLQANYPFNYISYRVTGYKRDSDQMLLLVGQALQPDLRLLIDMLSKSVDIAIDEQPTQTTDQVAQELHVSPKTIERWRKDGLRWRWVKRPDQVRQCIGITETAIEQFTADHPDRVTRAGNLTQIPQEQYAPLLKQAKELCAQGKSLNKAAVILAKEQGRAVETIRRILENHDKDSQKEKIFPGRKTVLNAHQKMVIYRARKMGVAMDKICRHFRCAPSTIYRAVNQVRATEAQSVSLRWIVSPTFTREDAGQVFLRQGIFQEIENSQSQSKIPLGRLPKTIRDLYRQPVITGKQQRSLFLRYNYLKYSAAKVRDGFGLYEVRSGDLNCFENYVDQAMNIRSFLVRCNMPVVLSVALRHVGNHSGTTNDILLLLETGFDELVSALEKYNASLNQRFDSFLTNRLLRQFAGASENTAHQARWRIDPDKAKARMEHKARRCNIDLQSGLLAKDF